MKTPLILLYFTLIFSFIPIRPLEVNNKLAQSTPGQFLNDSVKQAYNTTWGEKLDSYNLEPFSPLDYSAKNQSFAHNNTFIFQFINDKGNCVIKSISPLDYSSNIHPIIDVNNAEINNIPDFNFVDFETISKKYPYSTVANHIKVLLNDSSSINFNYISNYYVPSNCDLLNNIELSSINISNVIIQKIDSADNKTKSGKGHLFTNGKVIDIEWSKSDKDPIKITDESGEPVFLRKGKTWWIILNSSSKIHHK